MRCRKWTSYRWLSLLAFLAVAGVACTEDDKQQDDGDSWHGVCLDQDGDGFGFECERGLDCDDSDPALHTDCGCAVPSAGCACEPGTEPVDCRLAPEHTGSGGLMCREGTRFCRDGAWTECEGIRSFEVPAPSELDSDRYRLKIYQDAAPQSCDPCQPDCYRVDDILEVLDGAVPNSESTTWGVGGGITISIAENDAGSGTDEGDEIDPVPPCDMGLDRDCDGIPDSLDPFPTAPPFETDHTTIFMDLAPGESDSRTFEIRFYLNTADIYFLIDMTGSMNEEKTQLFSSLRNGNFLDDPATTGTDESLAVECSDRAFDGTPDNELKTGGITGNIACLIRSSGFGLGWYREIPFSMEDESGIQYSYPNFEAFEHRQNIDENVALTANALDILTTRSNQNWAESATVALSAVATGGPIYMGWDRPGIPRQVCPSGRHGYPCFRNEAVPLVILITDAPLMNGPVPPAGNLGTDSLSSLIQPVNYQPRGLSYMSSSSDGLYYPVPNTNETFASAYDVGVIDDSFKTYTGDTRSMTADINSANLGANCGNLWPTNAAEPSMGYPDAVFRFRVNQSKNLTISTRGTRHKPTLAIVPVGGAPVPPPQTQIPVSGNYDFAHVQDIGTLSGDLNLAIRGDTTSHPAGFPTFQAKECYQDDTVSYQAPGAVVSFQVDQDMPAVQFAAAGSDFDAMLALYEAVPPTIEQYPIQGPSGANTNDFFYQWSLPPGTVASPVPLDGRMVWLNTGNTGASGLTANFPASGFWNVDQADTSCNAATGTVKDSVVDFRLDTPRRVYVETTSASDPSAAAGFDHIVALIERPATLTALTEPVAGNDNQTSAWVINESDVPPETDEGAWLEREGYLANYSDGVTPSRNDPTVMMTDDVEPQEMYSSSIAATSTCSSITTGHHDVVFRFNVNTEDDYDIDTLGSGFNTYLSLHRTSPDTFRTVASNLAQANTATGQDLGTVDGMTVRVTGGNTNSATNKFTASQVQTANSTSVGCRRTNSNLSKELVYRFTVATPRALNIRLNKSSGWDAVLSLFGPSGLPASSTARGITCGRSSSTSQSLSTGTLAAGTYYVVVHGYQSSVTGSFTSLDIVDAAWDDGLIACDAGSHPNARGRNSLIRQHLTAGTYYIVVKGTGSSVDTTHYYLNVRRTQDPPVIACNYEGLGNNRSALSRDLPPGNYSVIVRGKTTGTGTYGVFVRDGTTAPVACHNESGYTVGGVDTSRSFVTSLRAGVTYYLVMRGHSLSHGNASGEYGIDITSGTASAGTMCAFNNTSYSNPDDEDYSPGAAEITRPLVPGDYYAVIKGNGDTNTPPNSDKGRGWYQISFGDATLQTKNLTASMPVWGTSSSGVEAQLAARAIRVISVTSTLPGICPTGSNPTAACTAGPSNANTALRAQADTVASATGALSPTGTPLRFDIKTDGSGMGFAVVQAVNQLAQNLDMDVSVRLVQAPDAPVPPQQFLFSSRAIDTPGDRCAGPVDVNADGVLDTHLNCSPGATPRFEITITNPPVTMPASTSMAVTRNPADPQGGYNMRLELVGDGRFIVDRIPVYIIPEDVVPNPNPPLYQESGYYSQDATAAGCSGTERPDWQSLFWNATMPSGTSLIWRVCGGETQAELDACSTGNRWKTAGVVTSGNACVDSTECPNGYCASSGVCEYVRGPACARAADCGDDGVCVANQCMWTDNPIDLKPALAAGFNGKAKMRVQVQLTANADRTQAPTIHDFRLNYLCAPGE